MYGGYRVGDAAIARGASSRPGLELRRLELRRSAPHRALRTILGATAAIAVSLAAVLTVITTAGRVFAVSVDAKMETRSLIGRTGDADGLTWFAKRDKGMIPRWTFGASQSSPESYTSASLFADQIQTGSIGRASHAFDTDATFAGRFRGRQIAREDERPAAPLPRSRPLLASLPSPDSPAILPQMDEEEAAPQRTAIYDITARAVYMPNGDVLEAHSGLGPMMDDPRHVRLRMRGVTPPNTYRLTMREKLFHGVEAIRLTPDNREAMFGRDGILAHTYMLGPSGQSNGCVSFKDYPKFLAAFKRGDVDRMVVVARLPKPPAYARLGEQKRVANLLQMLGFK
jgi:hypothetical protein